jgi:uncharacterized protein DUF6636
VPESDGQLLTGAFAEFRDEVAPYVRPDGAAATRETVRRRKRNHVIALGALAVLVFAVPAAASAMAGGDPSGPPAPQIANSRQVSPAPAKPAPHVAPPSSGTPRSTAPSSRSSATVRERTVTGKVFGFSTPSRNIMCVLADDDANWHGVRCDVRQQTWKLPPKPATCPYEYGSGIRLGTDAAIDCATDSVSSEVHTTLQYGEAATLGDFRCEVADTGVRCDNNSTGHGFTASRSAYRLY